MNKQIILCVESNKKAATDNIYIKDTINHFYAFGNEIKLSFINMDGKQKYKNPSVVRMVNQLVKDYRIGQTVVIYCIDLDRYGADQSQVKENEAIKEYVTDNGFELIWFCHDIEEVYLGHSVDNSSKTKTSIEFKTKGAIKTVDESKLKAKKVAVGKSNILEVLDKYLERKK